ncbi:MAG: type VII secretion AAA-ATPase EccA [Mycolicibacterium sp.]|uniref:type VII secretion AAA-ATPase EccA n=1 Tax=Mycolicibacterium sp. TaxID=2320850 RepID=UPI003D144A2E
MTAPNPGKLFEAGLLALGFQIGNQRERPEPQMAARVLRMATSGDPHFADAWLGRLAAGDTSIEVYEGLWASRSRLGTALDRYGRLPADLGVRFHSSMLITAPLGSADAVTAAYVTALADQKRFDQAQDVFTGATGSHTPLTTYAGACMYYSTGRWPQVIELATLLRGDIGDPVITAAARALVVAANTHLGLYGAALDLAGEPIPGSGGQRLGEVLPEAAATVSYYTAMCHRATGNEAKAAEGLRTVLAIQPEFPGARDMLSNPDIGLATTDQHRIDARTDPWDPATEGAADAAANAERDARRGDELAEALRNLDEHIGLTQVKRAVAKLRASVEISLLREEQGLPPTTRSRHLVLIGPPGVGKTTVARVIARIYCSLGLLAKDTVVEVRREDLVGSVIGDTEKLTKAVIERALDGVLIIDEAYTLVNTGSSNDFGLNALNVLLAALENYRDRLIVMVAGYPDEMQRFLSANEGLRRRFPKTIDFPSYSVDELGQIAVAMAANTQHTMTEPAQAALAAVCSYLATHTALPPKKEHQVAGVPAVPRPMIDLAGNGGFIRNVIEFSIEEQEFRAHRERAAGAPPDLSVLTAADVVGGLRTVLEGDTDGVFVGVGEVLDMLESDLQ